MALRSSNTMVLLGDVVTGLVLFNCRSSSCPPTQLLTRGKQESVLRTPAASISTHSPYADWVPPAFPFPFFSPRYSLSRFPSPSSSSPSLFHPSPSIHPLLLCPSIFYCIPPLCFHKDWSSAPAQEQSLWPSQSWKQSLPSQFMNCSKYS